MRGPARFIRIYKAVGIPDEDTLDFDGSAFGLTDAFGMRELIGYAPVEPDGSVMVKVPADIPFAIDVLDRNGRRIFSRHSNWLQVRPGEVRECNGCHDPASDTVSHGRSDGFRPLNEGAPSVGYIFPNTNLGTSAELGETMAETRARFSCYTDCSSLEPSIDLNYEDVWTDVNVREPDASFSLSYDDIVDTELPERDRCLPWTVDCRVIINYEAHIQPLWELPREVIDPVMDNRCIDCHALRNAGGELIAPDARGQLELTRNASGANPNHFTSYRELLAGDVAEAIIDGAVQPVLRDTGEVDEDQNPIREPVFLGSRLSLAGANASEGFFDFFVQPGSHQGWLSEAELRLIAEWLDMGGQYFNNPFDPDVPLN